MTAKQTLSTAKSPSATTDELLETKNETTLAARQPILNKQQFNYNSEELCFLIGPCQDVMTETSLEVSCMSVCEEKTRRLVWDGRQPRN
jgi:hypothetical protein